MPFLFSVNSLHKFQFYHYPVTAGSASPVLPHLLQLLPATPAEAGCRAGIGRLVGPRPTVAAGQNARDADELRIRADKNYFTLPAPPAASRAFLLPDRYIHKTS